MLIVGTTLSARIKALRVSRNMTQRDLAKACGLTAPSSNSTVAKWEAGIAAPGGKRIPKVASALGVSVGELYGEAA